MKKRYLATAAVLLALTAGCSKKDAATHYHDAQQYLGKQQYNAAIIELKSALSQTPDNPDYRLLLGRVYMLSGDVFSAEKEFEQALRYGADKNQVAVERAQASFLAENYQGVLSLFENDPEIKPEIASYLTFYRALSEIELGDTESAISLFDQLIHTDNPDIVNFSQAVLYLNARQPEDALASIQNIPESSVIYRESLLLNAHLLISTEQTAAGLAKLQQYIERVPSSLRVRLMVAQLLLQQNDTTAANEQLQFVLRVVPEHGLTNYLKALIEFDAKNYSQAKEHIDKALANRFVIPQARILAGLITFQLQLEQQALSHLAQAKDHLYTVPAAQRLYAYLQLKAGETNDAAAVLATGELTPQDLELVATTASQLLQQGNANIATEVISRYEQAIDHKDAVALQTLGRIKIGISGQELAGLKDLEQALLLDPAQHQTRVILASSYIRQQQYDKAAALADDWLKEDSTHNAAYNLKALVHVLQQQYDDAIPLLESAGKANSENVFTLYLKAIVAHNKQLPQQADRYLERAIELQADYLPALLAYFASQKQQGSPEKALKAIENASASNPQNNELKMLLASLYQQEQRFAEIIQILQPVTATQQQLSSRFYQLLTDGYIKTGKLSEATSLTERWYNQNPTDEEAGYILANLLLATERLTEARNIIDKVLPLNPTKEQLIRTKLAIEMESQNYKAALELYSKLPRELAESAEMLFHKGRLQLMDGQVTPGIATLNQSYQKDPSPITVIAIADAYAKDVSYRRAIRFVEEHFAKYGNDNPRLQNYYATLLIQDDASKAVAEYEQLLQREPDNLVVLNNYAWVLTENGQAEKALPHIEKAISLNSKHPDILDTYGKILLLLDKPEQALQQFQASLAIRPVHAGVQYNQADALARTGKTKEALAALQAIKTEDQELQQKVATLQLQLK